MSKITVKQLRQIIREEVQKTLESTEYFGDLSKEEWDDHDNDETGLVGKICVVDRHGFISPYEDHDEYGPVKFGPSKHFKPGEEVELFHFIESGEGAWRVTDPGGGRGETLRASN